MQLNELDSLTPSPPSTPKKAAPLAQTIEELKAENSRLKDLMLSELREKNALLKEKVQRLEEQWKQAIRESLGEIKITRLRKEI